MEKQPQTHQIVDPLVKGDSTRFGPSNMEVESGWQVQSNKWKVSSPARADKSAGDLSPRPWVKSYKDAMVHSPDRHTPALEGFEMDNRYSALGLHFPFE